MISKFLKDAYVSMHPNYMKGDEIIVFAFIIVLIFFFVSLYILGRREEKKKRKEECRRKIVIPDLRKCQGMTIEDINETYDILKNKGRDK